MQCKLDNVRMKSLFPLTIGDAMIPSPNAFSAITSPRPERLTTNVVPSSLLQ
jgi:hypothetical protein